MKPQDTAIAQSNLSIEGLHVQIREGAINRYTSIDAGRDFKLRDQIIERHERRITDIERGKK